ncbi:8988_t:CDS:2, partial [Ambispora gerdemannii]
MSLLLIKNKFLRSPATSQSPPASQDYSPPPSPSSNSSTTPFSLPAPLPQKPSRTGNKSVPAFLNKLYNMVNDPQSNELITWSEGGTSFLVKRPQDFAREVLPRFFKHNNFSSFVRQLNMYGFHKIPHLQQGVLQSDGQSEQWEFIDLNQIMNEITSIKKHQMTISSDLKNIQRDNQVLWQETISARERHRRQQETIDKILRFLASVFSAEKKRAIVPRKRRLLLGNGDGNFGTSNSQGLTTTTPEQRPNWTPFDAANQAAVPTNATSIPNELDLSSWGLAGLDLNNPALSILASLAVNDPSPGATNLPQFDFFNNLNALPNASTSTSEDANNPAASSPNASQSQNNVNGILESQSTNMRDIESRINALESNLDYVTSQLGFDPEEPLEHEDQDGDAFMTYYGTNILNAATEQHRQMLFNLMGSNDNNNSNNNPAIAHAGDSSSTASRSTKITNSGNSTPSPTPQMATTTAITPYIPPPL